MGYPVTLIRGDGVGAEVTEAVRIVVEATGIAVDWNILDAGSDSADSEISSRVLGAIRETKVALLGPFALSQSARSAMRQQLQLYARLQSAKSRAGANSNTSGLDLLLVYESAEVSTGFELERTTHEAADVRDYLARMLGTPIYEDVALGVRMVSVLGCRRLLESAFQQAQVQGYRKVTAVHKSDMLPFTDGLFLEVAREMAKDYPLIEFEDSWVDTLCPQLIRTPQNYDVVVMPHLYGQMLSALCRGIKGGASGLPGASLGDEYAVFEVVPRPANQNLSLTTLILSSVMLLRHLGEQAAAQRLQTAVETVTAQHATGGLRAEGTQSVLIREMADAIASAI